MIRAAMPEHADQQHGFSALKESAALAHASSRQQALHVEALVDSAISKNIALASQRNVRPMYTFRMVHCATVIGPIASRASARHTMHSAKGIFEQVCTYVCKLTSVHDCIEPYIYDIHPEKSVKKTDCPG